MTPLHRGRRLVDEYVDLAETRSDFRNTKWIGVGQGMKTLGSVLVWLLASAAHAAEYPAMEGLWTGVVRTVTSGEMVRDQVARGGVVIAEVALKFKVTYQDREVFMGESSSDATDARPVPVSGAIRSTGKEAVFVTANGGRGEIWFNSPTQFEYCFANATPEQMSSHCAVLNKQ